MRAEFIRLVGHLVLSGESFTSQSLYVGELERRIVVSYLCSYQIVKMWFRNCGGSANVFHS